jgi:hypothetical protein
MDKGLLWVPENIDLTATCVGVRRPLLALPAAAAGGGRRRAARARRGCAGPRPRPPPRPLAQRQE